MIKNKSLELYFHIPFCVKKCLYCDFLSAPADQDTQDAYMRALINETKERRIEYSSYEAATVFIGGGTPSAVSCSWLEQLMETVRKEYRIKEDAEISMELNPGTADIAQLRRYRKMGINRLSIGLQSALDEELVRLGRIHTFKQFLDTYKNARKVGFNNVNVDIMSALPGQSAKDYQKTLSAVMELNPTPEHISAYSLIIEEGTPFFDEAGKGCLMLPDEECDRQMYRETDRILTENGYHRYEISNYAKPDFECRHNSGYWQRQDYAGFGIGAASLVNNHRFANKQDMAQYLKNPPQARTKAQMLSIEEQMEEYFFLGLRLVRGVSLADFERQFGIAADRVYGDVIAKSISEQLLIRSMDSVSGEESLCLTEKGLDLSNYVMARFLLS